MADFEDNSEQVFDHPSKSQRKRELSALRDLGEKLLSVHEDQLTVLSPEIVEAVLACKKITKGNARKRQLQYIGKLLRSADNVDQARDLVDRKDAGTRAYTAHFHQLELWRERLIAGDDDTMAEIMDAYPNMDRQHFRHLVKNAIAERVEERE
ncbi:MAG: ribosome biogenesis factor YjgA, partial [Pseudomonadales bacterium]